MKQFISFVFLLVVSADPPCTGKWVSDCEDADLATCSQHYADQLGIVQCGVTSTAQCLAIGSLCTAPQTTTTTSTTTTTLACHLTRNPAKVWRSQGDFLVFHTRDSTRKVTDFWQHMLMDDMTWEVWFNTNAASHLSGDTPILGAATGMATYESQTRRRTHRRRHAGVHIKPDGTTLVKAHVLDSLVEQSHDKNISDGQWHHVALVFAKSSASLQYYLDGSLAAKVAYAPGDDNVAMDGQVLLGGRADHLLSCKVSRFALWTRAFSHSEIRRMASTCDVSTNQERAAALYTLDGSFEECALSQSLQPSKPQLNFESCGSDCQVCDISPIHVLMKGPSLPSKVWKSDGTEYLVLPTMSGNKKTSLWEKLSKGDMTWEMMYQGDAKTDAYAQVMSTRGYDSAGGSRRRWVGVELTDDGQHLRAHSSLHHSRVDSQVNVNDGRWHHLALVLSQSQKYLELYVDGERQGRADYPVTDSDDPSSVTGGIEFCRSFACNVSRLGIWSRALQHGELARVTSSSCAEDDTNLEVYYQLDGDFADLRRQGPTMAQTGSFVAPGGRFVMDWALKKGRLLTCESACPPMQTGPLCAGPGDVTIEYLVVAGGGGGGHGGGGGGGLVKGFMVLPKNSSWGISVGKGGGGGSGGSGPGRDFSRPALDGGSSQLGPVRAFGGGHGADSTRTPGSGGSGGGGSYDMPAGPIGRCVKGQGHDGGRATLNYKGAGGGGGGAGEPGKEGSPSWHYGGSGGDGILCDLTFQSSWYSGGGGSGVNRNSNDFHYRGGYGGKGGGGSGSHFGANGGRRRDSWATFYGTNGEANTGGGGGGTDPEGQKGGSGGSGIVVIRYPSPRPLLMGGTPSFHQGFQIHTFTAGKSTLSFPQEGHLYLEYLVVAGGGGAGTGGGGAGGVLKGSEWMPPGVVWPVKVGAGGQSGTGGTGKGYVPDQPAKNGEDSQLGTLVALGGGHGADSDRKPGDGGSGGGGTFDRPNEPPGNNTAGQGHTGGLATDTWHGAGGGGGGDGVSSDITGAVTWYGGGGGSGVNANDHRYAYGAGKGGMGGGGRGSNFGCHTWGNERFTGSDGRENTGGGGGGTDPEGTVAGKGGSGIVVVRYRNPTPLIFGGAPTFSNGYTIHWFTTVGASALEFPTPGTETLTLEYLVVGGGGGAGTGGGGAGGLVKGWVLMKKGSAWVVSVGAGGQGGTGGNSKAQDGPLATSGEDSQLGDVLAAGGGKGCDKSRSAGFGGSGGGACNDQLSGPVGQPKAGQGHKGGTSDRTAWGGAGGGGGAGGAGGKAPKQHIGGSGGDGLASDITGTLKWYGGGGGGGVNVNTNNGHYSGGEGGRGGGGRGSGWGSTPTHGEEIYTGTDGESNTGGGGGGTDVDCKVSGNGGSGIVVVRYQSAVPRLSGGFVTSWNGYQIHTFTSLGRAMLTFPDQ
ncbi:unnamed protein product [Effrenium voratum]|nr:unnamed protein product [Effrenium voratum]